MRGFYLINKIGWSFSPADIMKKRKLCKARNTCVMS